jgi:nitrite reductase/ring-hydroxylating ferredoxin subunit
MAVYYATKAYVLSFSEALANELKGSGVTVTCLCPGGTRTGLHGAGGKWANPETLRKKSVMMEASVVARRGVDGLMKGSAWSSPESLNKLLAHSTRLGSRGLSASIVRASWKASGRTAKPGRRDMRPDGDPSGFAPCVRRALYVACASHELRAKVAARTLLGTPLVLFRGRKGSRRAARTAAPIRNAPLSVGRVVEQRLECRYHGWQFGIDGRCLKIPGLCAEMEQKIARNVPRFRPSSRTASSGSTRPPDVEPQGKPFAVPSIGAGAVEVRRIVQVESPLHAALENALDVPHTAVLHRGLFRGKREPQRIKARVSRTPTACRRSTWASRGPRGWARRSSRPRAAW